MTDVFLLKQKIEPGKTERCKELIAELMNRVDSDVSEILETEGVYTESVFIEQGSDDEYLVWYFEAEDAARVGEMWEEPAETGIEGEIEDGKSVLAEVLENPAEWGEDDFELLQHLVNPNR
ncbi:hypothetical protein SAMN05421858_3845 [Haladaptatus litoreus]|uniref:ABM domain-containing protein n=1 Tax=Haladaptatus litoreus TaxID=553468 RepID=A0A1N7DXZ5_9EURY|nr:DUF6176 family protein [Haladaptatus litoreus]SIR80713.1 hypothetical protein SAMN05421858_3845 [Haladaptatus litoreus]